MEGSELNQRRWRRSLKTILIYFWIAGGAFGQDLGTRAGTLYEPYLEWSLTSSFSGNAFDVVASATFTHTDSGDNRMTQMFHDGGDRWRFRFTGTRTGEWTFTTTSDTAGLDGRFGIVNIQPNSDPAARGFLKKFGNKWGWEGMEEAFVPQLVMYVQGDGSKFASLTESQLQADIQEYLVEHGFRGFHVPVMLPGVWMTSASGNADPRIETFQTLEMIITNTHAAGGMVHLWIWGDEQRGWSPNDFTGGKNGSVDRRLQRYIAARLGPLPGWSAGYGFDLWEWAGEADLISWHQYMHQQMGWFHFLGGRASKDQLNQIYEGFDYSGYEWHRPSYGDYVDHLEARSEKPSMSEDRFRIRDEGRAKDYNEEETRRGLWHSAMAGGVANIWGDLRGSVSNGSVPYSNKEQIKTHSVFWKERFLPDLVRANQLSADSNTRVLRSGNDFLIGYREGADSIQMDLSGMSSAQAALGVDTKAPYSEISLGSLNPASQTIPLPYSSDWAIVVGEVEGDDPSPPSKVTGVVATPVSESQIELTWDPAVDEQSGISAYQVYRDEALVGSTESTKYLDTGFVEGATYSYSVVAVNGDGILGPPSDSVSVATLTDTNPPVLESANLVSSTSIIVVFSEPVEESSSEDTGNYSLDHDAEVFSAQLGTDLETVTLTTSVLELGTTYMLTVNDVRDRSPTPNAIAPNSQVSINTGPRVTSGLVVLYEFREGEGGAVYDTSGAGSPLDLQIAETEPGSVTWLPGGVEIRAGDVIRSAGAATKIIDGVAASGEISVETWVKPANTTQSGPARLVTISQNTDSRNFTLGQEKVEYHARLRTTDTTVNGLPSMETGSEVALALQHVVYTCDSLGNATLYVDNEAVANENVGIVSNWSPAHSLGIGNELTLNRGWSGEVYLVGIYDRALTASEVQQNHDAGPTPPGDSSRFELWALQLPPESRGRGDNPDDDSFPNLFEYALGGAPSDALAVTPLSVYYSFAPEDGAFTMELHDTSRTDVQYQIEHSPSLNTVPWGPIARKEKGASWASLVEGVVVDIEGAGVRLVDSRNGASPAYYRIVVLD